jgi:hypothetical protein
MQDREPYTVKLCDECCYTPEDLGELYNPESEFWCCGQCKMHDIYKPSGVQYPREREKEPWFHSI